MTADLAVLTTFFIFKKTAGGADSSVSDTAEMT